MTGEQRSGGDVGRSAVLGGTQEGGADTSTLLKTVDAASLRGAVRRVAAGEGVLVPEVVRRVLGQVAAMPTAGEGAAAGGEVLGALTPREHGLV